MIYEFALNPRIGCDWRQLQHLLSHCGVEFGRLIAQYPKDWIKRVNQSVSPHSELDKIRLTQVLQDASNRRVLMRRGRSYDNPAGTWTSNALISHSQIPFKGILTHHDELESPRNSDVIDYDNVQSSTKQWELQDTSVRRTATDIVLAAELLLQISAHIKLIDQHFSTYNPGYLDTLINVLRSVFHQRRINVPIIDVHYGVSDGTDRRGSWVDFDELQKFFRERKFVLPSESRLDFYEWKNKTDGENRHARYILTDLGGLSYDYGLRSTTTRETTDVHRLSCKHFRERWAQYDIESTVFELVGHVEFRNDGFKEIPHSKTIKPIS